jgi:hypothetical protein
MNKTKEEIIHDMCLTYRHDYGLRKQPGDPSWTAGMTAEEAKMLYKTMEQIYTNDIEPMMEHYERKYNEAIKRRESGHSG